MPATDLMKTLKIIGAVLIVVLALAWLQRSMNPKPIEDEAMPPYAVGQVLAEQAAKATRGLPIPKIKDVSVIECAPAGVRLTVANKFSQRSGRTGGFSGNHSPA